MNDEITIRFGGDLAPLASAMRGVKGMVKDFGSDMVKSLSSIASAWIGVEGVMKIEEWAKETIQWAKEIKNLAEETGTSTAFIQGLQHVAMTLGLDSTKAGDAVNFLSRKIGEAREGSKSAQEVFARWGININGKSNEEIFYAISDALAKITDPAARAAMRFELLGKAGKEMAEALDHGSGAVKEVMAQASTLSDAQLQQLSNLGRSWRDFFEQVETGWKRIFAMMGSKDAPQLGITEEMVKAKAAAMGMKPDGDYRHTGKFVSGRDFSGSQLSTALQALIEEKFHETSKAGATEISHDEKHKRTQASLERAKHRLKPNEDVLKTIKEAEEARHQNQLKAMAPEQRLLELTREKLELNRKIHDTDRSIADRAKDQVELQKKLKSIAETQHEIEQKKLKAGERQNEILKARDDISKLGRERTANKMSEYMPSLEELANSGYSVFRHNEWETQQGPFAGMARQLLNLQSDAKQSLIWGNKDRFNQDTSRIDELKKALTSAGVMSPDDRLQSIDDSMTEAKNHLKELNEKAAGDGIKIQVPDA